MKVRQEYNSILDILNLKLKMVLEFLLIVTWTNSLKQRWLYLILNFLKP